MKFSTIVLLGFAIASLSSCSSSEEQIIAPIEETTLINLKVRSIEEAIDIAKTINNAMTTSSRSVITVDENNVSVICSTKSRTGENDTLFYAVNNTDENGFTLVAAPRNIVPVLAVTESGSYDSEETTQNTEFQYAVSATQDYIINNTNPSVITQDSIDSKFKLESITLDISTFPFNRVNVAWNQAWPENIYCPNKIAGCFPVAVAQICSYFEKPDSISLTFEGRDQNYQIFDWANIKKHVKSDNIKNPSDIFISSHYNNCEASTENHKALARFIRQIGVIAHSNYKANATSTYAIYNLSTLRTVLPNYSFKTGSKSSDLYSLLMSNDGVSCCAGWQYTPTDTIGHAWIADGAWRIGNTFITTNVNNETEQYTYESDYIHYNWG